MDDILDAAGVVEWIEKAPEKIAAGIQAPADMRRRVMIMITTDSRTVQVDARWNVGIGRSLTCRSGKTLAEAVNAVRAELREKGFDV